MNRRDSEIRLDTGVSEVASPNNTIKELSGVLRKS
jgi:hypothetical protein